MKAAPCWVVDFACKINSLHLRTTSGWPKVLPRKSGENHFFDTLLKAPVSYAPLAHREKKYRKFLKDHLQSNAVDSALYFILKMRTRFLLKSCFYKLYQSFYIVVIVIITVDAFAVINHPVLLIPFQAIQKIFFPVPSNKLGKGIRFHFAQ